MTITNKEQKAEAIIRMKILGISNEIIRQFEKDGTVYASEQPFGKLYPIHLDDKIHIKQFEEDFSALVYVVVRTATTIGYLDSYLYVSKHRHEWEKDRLDLKSPENGLFAYVYNHDEPDFSEIGSIGILKMLHSGLIRIW